MVLTSPQIRERMTQVPLQSTGDFHRLEFLAMGTTCRVDFAATSERAAREFRQALTQWVAEFECRYSRFLPDSLLSRINAAAGREAVPIDAETAGLLGLCDWYHWLTRGVFDPSSLPLQQLWDYHRPRAQLPSDDERARARALVNWKNVRHDGDSAFLPVAGMAIDLGGIGKEYAVDRVVDMARERGLTHVLVDFGHDVRACGSPPEGGPWRIGLEHPGDPGRCWAGVAVSERAVCASGNYLRYVEITGRRYGHIVDPLSGLPVANGVLSATAIAATCTEAGILSTASYILGEDEGLRFMEAAPQAEGCLWTEKGSFSTGGFLRYVITS